MAHALAPFRQWHPADEFADAARAPIGFANGHADDAVRNVGRIDHAGDKLDSLIAGAKQSKQYRAAVREHAVRILESPLGAFDHTLKDVLKAKGFLGEINGEKVVFFVAKESKGKVAAGDLITGWIPSSQQLANWGF